MFRGSVPRAAQLVISEIVSSWTPKSPIQVLCSGNLTLERAIEHCGHPVYGNDVTIYSCALGSAAAGMPFRVKIADNYMEKWGWLEKFTPTDDPAATAATIVLMTRCISAIDKPDHPYYARLAAGTVEQWDDLHAGTVAKFRKNLPKLAGFKIAGALEVLRDTPTSHGVITFPPFFAGDYEAMFRRLAQLFQWDAPKYEQLNDESIQEMSDRAMMRDEWVVALPVRSEKLAPYLVGMTLTTNRGVPINFYSSKAPKRLVLPRQDIEQIKIPRLGKEEDLEGKLDVIALTGGQFSMVRSQYMSPHIVPGSPTLAMGVVCGKRLIGAFAFASSIGGKAAASRGNHLAKIGPHTYLLSDFPTAPSKYKRLSKLILYAALSNEVRAAVEQSMGSRCVSLLTTAFSDRPVSMKYRGLFEILTRKEDVKPKVGKAYKFQLNYWSPMGRWTLAEGLAEWKSKHAITKDTKDTEPC